MHLPWGTLSAKSKRQAAHHTYFLTLTYPSEYPKAWQVWKAHLQAFRRRLGRAFPFEWCIWKMEPQKRGAPHFHLAVYFPSSLETGVMRSWLSRAWFEVVGSGDERHLRSGTGAQVVYNTNTNRLMHYLAKYMGKAWASDTETGRVWGVWGDLPQVELEQVVFHTWLAWVQFQRRLRRWGKRSRYLSGIHNAKGIRLYGEGLHLVGLLRGLEVSIIRQTARHRVTVDLGPTCPACGALLNGFSVCRSCGVISNPERR